MEKRNKGWRRDQQKRVFKSRMVLHASYGVIALDDKGNWIENAHWFELAKMKWCRPYRTTGTPCSCWMCRGESYNRLAFKKDTRRIIEETEE